MKTAQYAKGPAGEGWKILSEPSDHERSDVQASINHWIIRAPNQSPAWEYYIVGCVHLRPVEGQSRPPHLRFPGATHEILILAVNPKLGDNLRPENWLERTNQAAEQGEAIHLVPVNYVHQFGGLTDGEASTLVDLLAHSIVNGYLPAEPLLSGGDYWTESLLSTIEHIQTGGHSALRNGAGKTRFS